MGNYSKCVLQVINIIYEAQLIFYLRIIFLISITINFHLFLNKNSLTIV